MNVRITRRHNAANHEAGNSVRAKAGNAMKNSLGNSGAVIVSPALE